MDDNFGSKAEVPELIPARMLSEFAYCPRLCYIEWIDGEFVDNEDTVDGRFQHRRVDAKEEAIPEDEIETETVHARSLFLTGPKVGITCRIDLLEGDGERVTPVDYKRGNAPNTPGGAYEPDRVQLCAQGLVLRENDFKCDSGIVYFVRSKKRITVAFDKALIQRTNDLISDLRKIAEKREIPPPLQDSPKCNRCSLAGICLPDDVETCSGILMQKKLVREGSWGRSESFSRPETTLCRSMLWGTAIPFARKVTSWRYGRVMKRQAKKAE
jgi:CRISPR-associated protein Cas1